MNRKKFKLLINQFINEKDRNKKEYLLSILKKYYSNKFIYTWHVTSKSKLNRYKQNNYQIRPPVRAWLSILEAERFSRSTGRPIILRLRMRIKDIELLEGHKNMAIISYQSYNLRKEGII